MFFLLKPQTGVYFILQILVRLTDVTKDERNTENDESSALRDVHVNIRKWLGSRKMSKKE